MCEHERVVISFVCVDIFILVCAYVAIFILVCMFVCMTTIKGNNHATSANKSVGGFKFAQRMFYMLENTLIVGIQSFLFLKCNFFPGHR